ncbi:hypothetical protein Q644_06275 [Brucella intermedia 229E]|uniref:Uncharacterized protein n=1 Tax=Brucella intermedia 229E TaxID=1337887 RepID=U4V6B6_9HYPH|nr:hypothetical protein Q644_06275 [Brucella intermedia 229E]
MTVAERKKSNPAIAAAVILIGFGGVLAYFVPSIMLALGERSQIAAIIFPIVFVLGFFAIFWLRSKRQNKD